MAQSGRAPLLAATRPSQPRRIRVKLTIAHADHNAANMDDLNLPSWCTWWHLHHDQPHRKETAATERMLQTANNSILATIRRSGP
jgi:hypothetical protein